MENIKKIKDALLDIGNFAIDFITHPFTFAFSFIFLVIFLIFFGIFCCRYRKDFQFVTIKEKSAKELEGEIQTRLTWKKWRSYIYDLFHRDASDKRRLKALPHKLLMYCEWLIGFFKINVLGRYLAFIFTIALTTGPILFQLNTSARLEAASSAVSQAESFALELQKNDDILKKLPRGYFHGEAAGLKKALEYLNSRCTWRLDKTKCQLDSVYLPRTYLKGIELKKAILYHSVLNGAYLREAKLNRAYLMVADLSKADLLRADLSHSILSGANLEGANLESANLRGANLFDAKFDKTDITNADFSDAKNLTPFQIMHACIYPYEEKRRRKPPQLPSYFEDFRDFMNLKSFKDFRGFGDFMNLKSFKDFRGFGDFMNLKNFKNFKNFMNLKSFKHFMILKNFYDFRDFDMSKIPDCDIVEQF